MSFVTGASFVIDGMAFDEWFCRRVENPRCSDSIVCTRGLRGLQGNAPPGPKFCPVFRQIDVSIAYPYHLLMHATIYGRGQMVIPAKARKEAGITTGDVVEVQPDGEGRIILMRLERPKAPRPIKAKITYRKGKHAVGSTGRRITSEQIRELLNEL
jgi:AbrB family looped-hinge helix DNA binding protein